MAPYGSTCPGPRDIEKETAGQDGRKACGRSGYPWPSLDVTISILAADLHLSSCVYRHEA